MERERNEERKERMGSSRCGRDTNRDRETETQRQTDTVRNNSMIEAQIFMETKAGVTYLFQTAGLFNFFCPVLKHIFPEHST